MYFGLENVFLRLCKLVDNRRRFYGILLCIDSESIDEFLARNMFPRSVPVLVTRLAEGAKNTNA